VIGRKAFTLIELLIVVAIIAILAAIAVPNFLEAQTRAKVSRVKSDIRSLATAIEAYRIDHNVYPPNTTGSAMARGFPEQINGINLAGTLWVDLSTPVAYMTNCFLFDVFNLQNVTSTPDEALFTYQNLASQYCMQFASAAPLPTGTTFSMAFCEAALDFYGHWRLGSVGPDMDFGFMAGVSAQIPYDATNGTVSLGNIWRSQNRSDNDMPDDTQAAALFN
jgi:prepilin-type N-terminal cleavage/methylation domain-containing protein